MKPVAADRLPQTKRRLKPTTFSSAVGRRCSTLQDRKVQQLQINAISHSYSIHAADCFQGRCKRNSRLNSSFKDYWSEAARL